MHGFGTMLYNDGSKYSGNWKNNDKNGEGVFWNVIGDKIEGIWRNGKQIKKIEFYKKTGSDRIIMNR